MFFSVDCPFIACPIPGQIKSEHIEAPTLLPEMCPSVPCVPSAFAGLSINISPKIIYAKM